LMNRKYNTRSSTFDDVVACKVTNSQVTTTISKNPKRNKLVSGDQMKRLPTRNETWHVVVNEDFSDTSSDSKRRRRFCVTLIGISKTHNDNKKADRSNVLAKTIVKGNSQGPDTNQIFQFLVDYMLNSVSGKPHNIAFENQNLYHNVVDLFENFDSSIVSQQEHPKIIPINEPEFNDQIYIHSMDKMKKTESVKLDELSGLTLKLVQQETGQTFSGSISVREKAIFSSRINNDLYASRTTTTRTITVERSRPFYAKPQNVLLILLFIGVVSYWVASNKRNLDHGNWPLDEELIKRFEQNLIENIPNHPKAIDLMKDIFQSHDGSKTLSINMVGDVDVDAKIVVKKISKLLFGSEDSERVQYLDPNSKIPLKEQAFNLLKLWPMVVFVLKNTESISSKCSFLTAMLDENYPELEHQGNKVKTNQAVFIMISDILHDQVDKALEEGSLDNLDQQVKQYLIEVYQFPARICQRIRNLVPFEQKIF